MAEAEGAQARVEEQGMSEAIIVGGGVVGATLACLLGQAGMGVTLLDARPGPLASETLGQGRPALRVSAVTPVSQRLLAGLGVWERMRAWRVTPYRHMQVWDGDGTGEVNFAADQAGLPELGHIVENDVMLAALEARLDQVPTVQRRFGSRVTAFEAGPAGGRIGLASGEWLHASVVVAADGARSPLREMAGIGAGERPTGHVALVTSVRLERPHGGVARQVFRRDGPLAFLPLTLDGDAGYCSIVWSTVPQEAERLAALSAEALGEELAMAIDGRLGRIEVIDECVRVPLAQRHAERYVQPGLALVGDAAHSLHPLAGQGVNLGLMDAAVLAEELLQARRRGVALGEARWLARYERRRRGDNAAMLQLMDGFRLLFAARHPALTLARNLGLAGVDRLSPLKRLLMQQATGQRGRLPASCR